MVTMGCLNESNLAKEQDGNNGQFEKSESSTSVLPESQLFELNKRIKHLESKLQETLEATKAKEQKVWELELVLSNTNFPKMDGTSAPLSVLQEVNSELEVLLKEKMEAEIEYSILRTTPNWKTVSEDHVTLLNELRYLAGDQEQMILKLRDAEDKTIKLSERTDELGAYSKELVGTEYVLRQQHIVCKFTLYFIFQLMLLCVSFGLFFMKLVFQSDGVVPT
ncbi:WPP domain-interacting protein 1-like [Phalaenopsis equestris]|uniref:WPP domain-interacting protein 1-like n=1 Tax=Phalaenopsis equestris TaxID=78828 RepID=UPI0009E4AF06|nr:WPP domain-interacting protein 1-like [Phalaenopsis equestris]XP_020597193.1 WPP domain-interacting protein 1-like [Phalaenopsis equestris]XP_020597194.1 WPP domain-interacting protein 1-like [Phalaenopsis equestris]